MSTESRLKSWKRKLAESEDETAKKVAGEITEYLDGSWREVKEKLDSLKKRLEADE